MLTGESVMPKVETTIWPMRAINETFFLKVKKMHFTVPHFYCSGSLNFVLAKDQGICSRLLNLRKNELEKSYKWQYNISFL